MPKILENVRERVLVEARRQVMENGYAKTTIRSVAAACGLGVGTVYNYFSSKDMLIASFMLEDWQKALDEMQRSGGGEPEAVLEGIYRALRDFSERYRSLFADSDAAKVFAIAFQERHPQLLGQLTDILRPLCERAGKAEGPFFPEFVAEALLTWTVSGRSFAELYGVLRFLFQ